MCAVAPVGDAGLLVVGGATKNGEFSDRAYVLDTKSYEWTELDALPDGRVLLSGGWDPATGGTFDDVWALAL